VQKLAETRVPKATLKIQDMITARVLLDSISPRGHRLTTMVVEYPRFIHSEFMTHRVFSRNSASSRAIPFAKMADAVAVRPALPERWTKNQKGMAVLEQVADPELQEMRWNTIKEMVLEGLYPMYGDDVSKSILNRAIEPWSHIRVLVSATQWKNFFFLRAHPDAMPEFQVLAYRMLDVYLKSKPRLVALDNWHIPFGDQMPQGLSNSDKIKVAVARAARLSYMTMDGKIDVAKDIELHDRLARAGHWSPFEHCARVVNGDALCGNFVGWQQYRKLFVEENGDVCLREVSLENIMAHKPDWISLKQQHEQHEQ
jgi:thymidylate synthase ThyX